MANHLLPIQLKFKRAKQALTEVVDLMETNDETLNALQCLTVTDQMAEIFRDKPVILINQMNIKFVKISNRINAALREIENIDPAIYREAMLRELYCQKDPTGVESRPLCMMCKKNRVELNRTTQQPHKRGHKYYGLCSTCRKRKYKDEVSSVRGGGEESG